MLKQILLSIMLLKGIDCCAQGITAKEKQLINSYLKERHDTTGVNNLLKGASWYRQKMEEDLSFRDSALLLSKESEVMSNLLHFSNGIIRSYISTISTCIEYRNTRVRKGQDGEQELVTIRSAEDQLMVFLKKENLKTGDIYDQLTQLYSWEPQNFEEITRLSKLMVDAYRNEGDDKKESEALYGLGFAYNVTGNLELAQETYLKSIEAGIKAGKKDLQLVYATLGNTYNFYANYKLALQYELQALRIAEAQKDESADLGIINLYLGLTCEGMDDDYKALLYYKKALSIFEKYPETNLSDLGNTASNVAKMMMYKNPAAAIVFMEEILGKYPQLNSDPSYESFILRLMQSNERLNRYDKAQEYCDKLLQLAENGHPMLQRMLYSAAIQFLVNSKQYEKAKSYLPVFTSIVQQTKELSYIKEAHFFWYRVDSAQGNYASALDHYTQYKSVTDSLFSETKAKEIAGLEVQYQSEKKDKDLQLKQQSIELLTKRAQLQQALTEKKDRDLLLKDKDISLLVNEKELQVALAEKKDNDIKLKEKDISILTKEALLKEASLSKAKATKNVMIAGSVMLILLLALLYNRYHLKQKINKEVNARNAELEKLVNEKEWLLKEIHHRVKNNLQTVVSLLESQSAYLDSDALLAIQESQNRVHAMSLVHQKLYQADNIAAINMAAYLTELVNYLRDSFNVSQQIQFYLEIEPVELDVSQAIPVGLILNEALTNSIKYAFPPGFEKAIVTVKMCKREENKIEFCTTDNGIGLPAEFKSSSNSLGIKLMRGLSQDLEGTFNIDGESGTVISVIFAVNTPFHALSRQT